MSYIIALIPVSISQASRAPSLLTTILPGESTATRFRTVLISGIDASWSVCIGFQSTYSLLVAFLVRRVFIHVVSSLVGKNLTLDTTLVVL